MILKFFRQKASGPTLLKKQRVLGKTPVYNAVQIRWHAGPQEHGDYDHAKCATSTLKNTLYLEPA
jgi:hypothetical protein